MLNESEQANKLEHQLSDEESEFLDNLADKIVRYGMTAPAMFMLEGTKPMAFLGSQLLHFFRPLVSIVWFNPESYDRLSRLLERRGTVELLLRRLEARN